jgi:hypothetical protein
MKKLFTGLLLVFAIGFLLSDCANAKGGMSSGGRHGGFSSGARSSHSVSRPSTPTTSPRVAAPAPRTTTTTTTTRTYSSRVTSGRSYGGMGMGYGYYGSNGLLTGMIIGSMMHPYGSMMYAGPGMYANNALLYPNGQVVTQQGLLVGTYINGVYTPVVNGGIVAQPAPTDAYQQPAPQPVIIQQQYSLIDSLAAVFLGIFIVILVLALLGALP